MASDTTKTDLVVIGGGPGGYAAAFYAAERGLNVTLVEREGSLGGVCLKRGCIPSKAYLHATQLIEEARRSADRGISFGEPRIDCKAMREWKDNVIAKLCEGIEGLAEKRNVTVLYGRGYFQSSSQLRVETEDGQQYLDFKKAIIATGSRSLIPEPFDLGSSRILTSKEALETDSVPDRLLVIGGGYIGLELGTVFARLGSKVTVAEAMDDLMPGADTDLVKIISAAIKDLFQEVHTGTKVADLSTSGESLKAVLARKNEDDEETTEEVFFDNVLVAVGRRPNSDNLGLENTAVGIDEKSFIETDSSRCTKDEKIFAIGDVAGGEMLAHKAFREAYIAVGAICGDPHPDGPLLVPAVVFTAPEMAWVGMDEEAAKEAGHSVEIVRYDWRSSGRALSIGHSTGMTKMVVDADNERILGVFMAGHGAGELIAEAALAIEMAATVRDLAETIHAHPTFSETLKECAESFFGISPHTL